MSLPESSPSGQSQGSSGFGAVAEKTVKKSHKNGERQQNNEALAKAEELEDQF